VTDQDWAALGDAVRERRLDRGYSQEQLVKRGGPSHQTVRNIERGLAADYRPTTFRNLDRALDWPRGTAEQVLHGTATPGELDGPLATAEIPTAEPCACVVGSPAWIDRELATERRINAIAQVFHGEVQRLLALVAAARKDGG